MRLPIRKSLSSVPEREDQDGPIYLTVEGFERLKRDIDRLERLDLPNVRAEVAQYVQQGDLSENAEYQEAKHRLSRLNSRLFYLQDRIKRVSVIDNSPSPRGEIQLGSTVTVAIDGKTKTYHLVGTQESNPAQGRISYLSPLGKALLGKHEGEQAILSVEQEQRVYAILKVI